MGSRVVSALWSIPVMSDGWCLYGGVWHPLEAGQHWTLDTTLGGISCLSVKTVLRQRPIQPHLSSQSSSTPWQHLSRPLCVNLLAAVRLSPKRNTRARKWWKHCCVFNKTLNFNKFSKSVLKVWEKLWVFGQQKSKYIQNFPEIRFNKTNPETKKIVQEIHQRYKYQ